MSNRQVHPLFQGILRAHNLSDDDGSECANGNDCSHPFCPEHSEFDPWDRETWPILSEGRS